MDRGAECEYLEWDSEFFGKRIGRLTVSRLDEALANQLEDWCLEQRIDCVYFLADSSDPETTSVAQSRGFRFVDARITLERGLSRINREAGGNAGDDEAPFSLRRAEESDIPALREMARTAHLDSRFYFDEHFPRERCNELYETWIERSCRGWVDSVFVAEEGETAAGYITCDIKDARRGQIGLVGVSEKARGKGVGTRLVSQAVLWFRKQAMERISVVTQGRNVRAQRLYQRCGFEVSALEIWFHRWFVEGERKK